MTYASLKDPQKRSATDAKVDVLVDGAAGDPNNTKSLELDEVSNKQPQGDEPIQVDDDPDLMANASE